MNLTLCSQPDYLASGASPAKCIDADRLSDVADAPIEALQKGNRPGCACDQCRDIGDYDSCPHGCVYCYAVATPALARQRHRSHDPNSAYLNAAC